MYHSPRNVLPPGNTSDLLEFTVAKTHMPVQGSTCNMTLCTNTILQKNRDNLTKISDLKTKTFAHLSAEMQIDNKILFYN